LRTYCLPAVLVSGRADAIGYRRVTSRFRAEVEALAEAVEGFRFGG
jgi:hypothetical protein